MTTLNVVFLALIAWLTIDAVIAAAIAALSTYATRRSARARAAMRARPSDHLTSCDPGGAEPPTGAGLDRSRSSHRSRNLL